MSLSSYIYSVKVTKPASSCASSPGKSKAHGAAAHQLARVFHEKEISLVYGGGTVGLMGELAKTLVHLSGKDSVHGIIPEALIRRETQSDDTSKVVEDLSFGQTTIVKDMHKRKELMARAVREGAPGSGFVALTGGYGTLEEIMEITTWNQLGIHSCPVVLFNVEDFWTPLLQWVKTAVDGGFISETNGKIMAEAKSAEEVITALDGYKNSEGRMKLKWDET